MICCTKVDVVNSQLALLASLAAFLAAVAVAFLDGLSFSETKAPRIGKDGTAAIPSGIIRAKHFRLQWPLAQVSAFAAAERVGLDSRRCSPNPLAACLARVVSASHLFWVRLVLAFVLTLSAAVVLRVLRYLGWLPLEALAAVVTLHCSAVSRAPLLNQLLSAQLGKALRAARVGSRSLSGAGLHGQRVAADHAPNFDLSLAKAVVTGRITELILVCIDTTRMALNRAVAECACCFHSPIIPPSKARSKYAQVGP